LISRAVRRLREEGVGPISSAQVPGAFVDVASGRGASVIVMGKRGDFGETGRRRLGSSVDPMVRRAPGPVCLTPRYFLPIHRAVVLLDADLNHRAALEFTLSDLRLAALPVDVVVVARRTEDAEPKATWARSVLGSRTAEIFPLVADGLDDAVADHMQSRGADIIVVSRAVIAPAPQARLEQIEERGVWGMRTPVLIC
jgi:nucleotide-binding universal stress UspA family protein